jgi:hypothetical protein
MFELATSTIKFGGELLGLVNRLPNRSWPAFLRRDSAKLPVSSQMSHPGVSVTVDRAIVALETQGTGELWLYLVVSNFAARRVTIDSLTVDYWLLQGQSMPEPTVIFRSSG